MRLGQLARKYGVSKKDIISYLKEVDPTLHSLGHNTKLNEQAIMSIAKHFENPETLFGETTEQQDQKSVREEVPAIRETTKEPQSELDTTSRDAEPQDLPEKDDVVIETDRLLELLESEEAPVDLSKITLIKAPKKELNGLKVVGKIDLPEPHRKKAEKNEQRKELKHDKSRRQQGTPLSDEELEKRRLKFKKRKEEHRARQEKIRKEKEKNQRKARNEARYRQKLQRAKPHQPKHKVKIHHPDPQEIIVQRPQPKTLVGKFWRWLNS